MRRPNLLHTVCLLLLLIGLVSVASAQNPKKFVSLANKAFKKGEYETALRNYETAFMRDPSMKQNQKFAADVDTYHETQILYGLQMAEEAESTGDLVDAWNWYLRVSRVASTSSEVEAAASDASRIRNAIIEGHLREAEQAESEGQIISAAIHANQARAYGSEEVAETILDRLRGIHPSIDQLSPRILTVNDTAILGDVKSGASIHASGRSGLSIPVLYGEAPMFYQKQSKPVQLKFHRHDNIVTHSVLAIKAKEAGADLVVNVQGYFKGEKFGTNAELAHRVKISDYPR